MAFSGSMKFPLISVVKIVESPENFCKKIPENIDPGLSPKFRFHGNFYLLWVGAGLEGEFEAGDTLWRPEGVRLRSLLCSICCS